MGIPPGTGMNWFPDRPAVANSPNTLNVGLRKFCVTLTATWLFLQRCFCFRHFGTIPRRSRYVPDRAAEYPNPVESAADRWPQSRASPTEPADLFAEEILESQLLLLEVGLGDDQIPLRGGHLGLRRHDVQRRQRPDLSLSLVVLVESLRSLQRLFRCLTCS